MSDCKKLASEVKREKTVSFYAIMGKKKQLTFYLKSEGKECGGCPDCLK
jgi:hypothetical protein